MVAVVSCCNPIFKGSSKNSGNYFEKRDLFVVDELGSIKLTLWNKMSENEYTKGDILVIKNSNISEFNGSKSMSTTDSTTIDIILDDFEDTYKNEQYTESLNERINEIAGWWRNKANENLTVRQIMDENQMSIGDFIPQLNCLVKKKNVLNNGGARLHVKDVNGEEISVTIWQSDVSHEDLENIGENSIVSLENLVLKFYQVRQLNSTPSSRIIFDVDEQTHSALFAFIA